MLKEKLSKIRIADIAHLRDYNFDSLSEDDYDMIWACIDNLSTALSRESAYREALKKEIITSIQFAEGIRASERLGGNIVKEAFAQGEKLAYEHMKGWIEEARQALDRGQEAK